jgi:hypothetical protein
VKLIADAQKKFQKLYFTPLERTKENDSLPRERFFENPFFRRQIIHTKSKKLFNYKGISSEP